MTTATTLSAVARAVARDAEARARAALDDVLAAHRQLVDADAAIAAATSTRATAGPALARAVTAALASGITAEQLSELGVTVPSARTLRRGGGARAAATGQPPERPGSPPGDGHHPVAAGSQNVTPGAGAGIGRGLPARGAGPCRPRAACSSAKLRWKERTR